MSDSKCDALVFFGASGDLAFKKIFPALQLMVKRGVLDVPVIGVANSDWGFPQLRARMRESLQEHGGIDGEAFARLSDVVRVDPVLKTEAAVYPYEPGSWGPLEAAQVAPVGGWQDPVLSGEPTL